jgi:hypothetical protein
MRSTMKLAAVALLVAALAAPAMAEEAKTPVSATLLLNILSAPVEPREAAHDEAIKREAPASRSDFTVQPDGSVRYGSGSTSVSVTVKNPCPPGTAHYEPPPLPGRRVRN